MKWTEAMIRRELKRLDELTGLHGNDLFVDFGNAKYRLGSFVTRNGKPYKFRFSRQYFGNERFSMHAAYDVIRHEYAHYMNEVLNGERMDGDHGEMWKKCCRRIGARPSPYYQPEVNEIYLVLEEKKELAASAERNYLAGLSVGDQLRHPKFGMGKICAIENEEGNARLRMVFASGEVKVISAKWMADMCGRQLPLLSVSTR